MQPRPMAETLNWPSVREIKTLPHKQACHTRPNARRARERKGIHRRPPTNGGFAAIGAESNRKRAKRAGAPQKIHFARHTPRGWVPFPRIAARRSPGMTQKSHDAFAFGVDDVFQS